MSLTSTNYDLASIRQQTMDSRNLYSYQADPVSNYRPFPGPLPAGVNANVLGNAQQNVDLESLLRNQSFVSSASPQYRAQSDACFAPYMQPQPLQCVATELTPRVHYLSRACDPLSGVTIDRFDPLVQQNAGFQYGSSVAAFGVNTVQAFKEQLERQRQPQQ